MSFFLEDSARNYPDRDALVLGDLRMTYASVNAMANQVAQLLVEMGVQPGDRVAVTAPNIPYFPIVYYGILKTGGVVVPMNVLNKAREIAYYLDDSGAKVYLCFEGTPQLPMAAEGAAGVTAAASPPAFVVMTVDPVAPSPIEGARTLSEALSGLPTVFESYPSSDSDTAVILYTSGTTGQPKGAELTHSNLAMNAVTCNRLFDSKPAHDTHLVALPLFHSFGASVQLNAGFSMAATLVLLPRFDAHAALATLERENVSFFAGVPSMWWGLLEALGSGGQGVDVRRISANLRLGISGGASLPVEILHQVRVQLGIPILEGYGLSETAPVATFNRRDHEPRPGSIGLPVWGVECKLIDESWEEVNPDNTDPAAIGEIAIRGHNIMKGYLNRPAATAEVMREGWFRTGDLARRDTDGFYYIVDRAKDMINRGGFNVYPREVEEVLMTHPDVSLAAVVGVPDEAYGEEVKAFVIRAAGASANEDDLIAWSREQMAAYKYPRTVTFVDSLPMTATGKILKRELVDPSAC